MLDYCIVAFLGKTALQQNFCELSLILVSRSTERSLFYFSSRCLQVTQHLEYVVCSICFPVKHKEVLTVTKRSMAMQLRCSFYCLTTLK